MEIFQNITLWSGVFAWFIAQTIKVLTKLYKHKKFDFERLTGSGGMPSSHSSFVTSLATCTGMIQGFDTTEFALAASFALVVMYDAAGVRNAVGKQARILNLILEDLQQNNAEYIPEKLKELIGHSYLEVAAGALLGITVGLVFTM